jgi:hypothetical protein
MVFESHVSTKVEISPQLPAGIELFDHGRNTRLHGLALKISDIEFGTVHSFHYFLSGFPQR